MSLLKRLEDPRLNLQNTIDYVVRCRNFDGGFGSAPGGESHAAQVYVCVGTLTILGGLQHVDADQLGWWLSERQLKNGGLNGRPEKLEDVCYSWWVLSSLSMLKRSHWIDATKLTKFILEAQVRRSGSACLFRDVGADSYTLTIDLFRIQKLAVLQIGQATCLMYSTQSSVLLACR